MSKESTSTERNYIECRSYTHARRHPFVIGAIGGWHLPSPLTPAQFGVLLGSLAALYVTRGIWAHLGSMNLIIMLGVPLLLTWLIRHMRMEGRAPLRMLIGYMTYVLTPRKGVQYGKPVREGKQVVLRNNKAHFMPLVYVEPVSGGQEK